MVRLLQTSASDPAEPFTALTPIDAGASVTAAALVGCSEKSATLTRKLIFSRGAKVVGVFSFSQPHTVATSKPRKNIALLDMANYVESSTQNPTANR